MSRVNRAHLGNSYNGYVPGRKLAATDRIDAFECSPAALNKFLPRHALVNQKANSAQTCVCCHDGVAVGFYSLAVSSVGSDAAPLRVMKGLARHLYRSMSWPGAQ